MKLVKESIKFKREEDPHKALGVGSKDIETDLKLMIISLFKNNDPKVIKKKQTYYCLIKGYTPHESMKILKDNNNPEIEIFDNYQEDLSSGDAYKITSPKNKYKLWLFDPSEKSTILELNVIYN